MLILSRKSSESIVIDGRIRVKIVRVEGDVVKIGIEAPADVPVHRQEVYEEIQRNNQQAAVRPIVGQWDRRDFGVGMTLHGWQRQDGDVGIANLVGKIAQARRIAMTVRSRFNSTTSKPISFNVADIASESLAGLVSRATF